MTGNVTGGLRRKFMGFLAASALVIAYLLGTLGVSSVVMTSSSTNAEAKGRRGGRGGGRGRGRGRRGRGRRGRGCSIVLWDLGLC